MTKFGAAFGTVIESGVEVYVCNFCGVHFAKSTPDAVEATEQRYSHLADVHKARLCNKTKKFFRADHFRQHLEHTHGAQLGPWTRPLENICMGETEPMSDQDNRL
jgi:rubredoxin